MPYSGEGGAANLAILGYVRDVALGSNGNLYILDADTTAVRTVDVESAITTLGSVRVSTSSPALDVTLTNNGNIALALRAITLPVDYNISGADTTCTATTSLAPAQSCLLGVVFTPTVLGPLDETLSIVDNQGTQTVSLIGTGSTHTTTATTLTVAPATPLAGGTVDLIASVTPVPTDSPFGTVTFYNNGVAYPGTPAINSAGVATFEILNVPAGSYSWSAAYAGNATSAASTSPSVPLTVAAPITTTTTFSFAPGSTVGQGVAVRLIATVVNGVTPVFPGTVNFCDATTPRCDGTAVIGSAQLTSSGIATYKYIPAPGSYSIQAVYLGVGGESGSVRSDGLWTGGADGHNHVYG